MDHGRYLSLIKEPQVSEESDGLIAAAALAVQASSVVELALPGQDITDEDTVVGDAHPLLVGDLLHQFQVLQVLNPLEGLVGDFQFKCVQRLVSQLRPVRFRHAHPSHFVGLPTNNLCKFKFPIHQQN